MRAPCRRLIPALAAVVAVAAFTANRAAAEDRVELPSRAGVTVPILYQPAAAPVASVVLFPGGVGVIAVTQGNFLLRVRGEFAARASVSR